MIFLGMGRICLDMALGEPMVSINRQREIFWAVAPAALLLAISLLLGLAPPARLIALLHSAAVYLGGV